MTKNDFNSLELVEQLKYINSELSENKSLRIIASDLKMSKTTFRDRFVKVGYVYNAETKQYYRDNTIKIQQHQITLKDHSRVMKQAIETVEEVIQKDNESISEVAIVKNENNSLLESHDIVKLKTALADVRELLEMKDQLKELIQNNNRSKSIIDLIEPYELRIDKDMFKGDLKGRLIKVYDNVNNGWIKFCKNNNQFKMQDLYSMALLEFIKKYKK